jgi:glutamyl-tRNA synthetase
MDEKTLEKKAMAYALKNALSHDGVAASGPVISALFNEGLEKSEMGTHGKKINEIISEVNQLSLEKQQKEYDKFSEEVSEREIREGLPELPNTKNKVVMRFAPSASGPLHIGHALVFCLNLAYVKKYRGKMFFRIEDTNPENVYTEVYDLLKEDSKWLSNGEAEIMVQSERLDLYYGYAINLIEKGGAYVCTCSGDEFREYSKKKKECPCRSKSIEENLKDWEKMIASNGFKKGEAVLRVKTPEDLGGMQHKNPAMRDFPIARINEKEHPHIKEKHKVWPLMNLSVAVDDLETGMTHIIRGKDHRDNAKRQEIIYKALGFENRIPWTGFLGRLHLKGLHLSTTEFKQGIQEGKYSGWDDPQLPTIQSLKKQGYKPEAFLKLAEKIGLSESDKTIEKKEFFYLLDECNREV